MPEITAMSQPALRRFSFLSMATASSMALLLLACAAAAEDRDTGAGRRLTLGTAKLKLVIPSEDWEVIEERRRPDNSSVYYALASRKRDLVFSFFIDGATRCRSAEACRDLALANPAFIEGRNLVLSERGRFSVAAFNLHLSNNQPVKQTHLLAESFVGGIGVDIHVSRSGAVLPDTAPLYEFLDTISLE
jgi:hypothetical protein